MHLGEQSVSTKLCIFCKMGTVLVEIEGRGKRFSCCAQGTDQSRVEFFL